MLRRYGANYDSYGVDPQELIDGRIKLTYEELQIILDDNPSVQIISTNDLREELASSE